MVAMKAGGSGSCRADLSVQLAHASRRTGLYLLARVAEFVYSTFTHAHQARGCLSLLRGEGEVEGGGEGSGEGRRGGRKGGSVEGEGAGSYCISTSPSTTWKQE